MFRFSVFFHLNPYWQMALKDLKKCGLRKGVMTMDSVLYALVSAMGNTSNSLLSAQALRTKSLSTASVTLLSLAPAFLISLIWSVQFWTSLTAIVFSLMILKNSLYGIAFYLRFRGFSQLGGFQGALLAASQPI